MPTKQYALIARESHPTFALVSICAITVQVVFGAVAATPAWVLLVLLFYLFRDPTQTPPSQPLAVVSPIYGQVRYRGAAYDPWLKRTAEAVVTHTGLFDIRSIYAPMEGKIMEQWSVVPNALPDDDNPPHSSAYWIRTDEDDDIVLVITRSPWGGRVSFGCSPGERIGHGRRIGFASFGCIARLYLPLGSRPEVAIGDHITAGSTIVATLIHLTRMAKSVGNSEPPVQPIYSSELN